MASMRAAGASVGFAAMAAMAEALSGVPMRRFSLITRRRSGMALVSPVKLPMGCSFLPSGCTTPTARWLPPPPWNARASRYAASPASRCTVAICEGCDSQSPGFT